MGVGPAEGVSSSQQASQDSSQQWWSNPLVHKVVDRICHQLKMVVGPSFSLGFSQEIMEQPSYNEGKKNLYDSQPHIDVGAIAKDVVDGLKDGNDMLEGDDDGFDDYIADIGEDKDGNEQPDDKGNTLMGVMHLLM